MPARRYPIPPAAIAEAARFIRHGRRAYTRAREPAHPSLRQVVGHLVVMGLVNRKKPPPPATLGRALERAGVEIPAHWRQRKKRKLDVNIFRGDRSSSGLGKKPVVAPDSLCSSVNDGGTRTTRRRAHQSAPAHPWRLVSMAGAP